MKYCPKCGFLLSSNSSQICSHCHTKIVSEEIEQLDFPVAKSNIDEKKYTKESFTKTLTLIILATFLTLLTILLFLFVLKELS